MADQPIEILPDPERPGVARLTLRGRVSVTDAARLHRAGLELAARAGGVLVDCRMTESIDGSILQVLICLSRDVVRQGQRFEMSGVSGGLAESLRLAGVEQAG